MKVGGRHSPDDELVLVPQAQTVEFVARQMLDQSDGPTDLALYCTIMPCAACVISGSKLTFTDAQHCADPTGASVNDGP